MTNRLLLDSGNSRLKAAWQTDGDCHYWHADSIDMLLQTIPNQPDEIWLSTVAEPNEQQTLKNILTCYHPQPIHQVSVEQYQHYLPTIYAPNQLGIDRWLAMLACQQIAPGPCLVVDCGTAATFDQVNTDGVHQGGYIVPGLALMQEALSQGTAIPAHQTQNDNPHLARDTAAAIQQGTRQALASLIHQMHQTMPNNTQVFISGGGGKTLLPYLNIPYSYKPHSVIDGLAYLAHLVHSE